MDKKTLDLMLNSAILVSIFLITYTVAASLFKTESMVLNQGSLLSDMSRRLNALTFISTAPVKEAQAEAGTDNADVPDL